MIVKALSNVINRIEKVLERNKKGVYIWVGPGEDPFKEEENSF